MNDGRLASVTDAAVVSTLAMLAFSGRLPVCRKALRGELSSHGTR